jgi:hypothetical protein
MADTSIACPCCHIALPGAALGKRVSCPGCGWALLGELLKAATPASSLPDVSSAPANEPLILRKTEDDRVGDA